jgi:hypothetical protein
MPLTSQTFSGDPRLEACLTQDSAHLTLGVQGDFVAKVQAALMFLEGHDIDEAEIESRTYGPSTADAVLSYKTTRNIVNRAYQSSPDNIVGKMTIKSLDDELRIAENSPDNGPVNPFCMREIIVGTPE